MIKNRFYKTTIGVPFELAGGFTAKAVADNANFSDFVADSVVGDYQMFLDDGTNDAAGVDFGTPLTAAQAKLPVRICYAVEKSGGVATVVSPTPLIGGTIVATNTPYAAPTLQDSTITKAAGTVQLGQELVFKVIETTPMNQNLPVYDYAEKVVTSLANAITAIVAKINAAKEDEWFTAVAGATSIQVISTDATRHFKLAIDVIGNKTFPVNDTNWTVATATKAFAGSGTLEQVRALELESNIKRGVTTQYPMQNANSAEFGEPISLVDLMVANGNTTFDVVTLTGTKYSDSKIPTGIASQKAHIFVIVPAGQGADIASTF